MKNQVLYFVDPHKISIKEESIPNPANNEVLVKNFISGISAGSELLIYRGLMPNDLCLDATIPSLKHRMTYPIKYGYCSVGQVVEIGNELLRHLLDKWVFAFHPHESFFCLQEEQLIEIPNHLSPYDAIFIPNMETAINFLLDSSPLIGENVLILGLGIVGILTTALLQQFPLSTLIGIDLYSKRLAICEELGATFTLNANYTDLNKQLQQCLNKLTHPHLDLIYELTGNPEALNFAIDASGYEGRIILGSWYGKKSCSINLGGKFHRNRIKIITSQVSTLASFLQGRWSKSRRLDVVMAMLEKIKPARFISHQFPITEASKAYKLLDSNPGDALFITLTHGG